MINRAIYVYFLRDKHLISVVLSWIDLKKNENKIGQRSKVSSQSEDRWLGVLSAFENQNKREASSPASAISKHSENFNTIVKITYS